MRLKLSPSAQQDLQEIYYYTEQNFGAKQAELYIDELWQKFQHIEKFPEQYKFRHDLYANCQIAVHQKHVILYRQSPAAIEVARILHSAMDLRKHL